PSRFKGGLTQNQFSMHPTLLRSHLGSFRHPGHKVTNVPWCSFDGAIKFLLTAMQLAQHPDQIVHGSSHLSTVFADCRAKVWQAGRGHLLWERGRRQRIGTAALATYHVENILCETHAGTRELE